MTHPSQTSSSTAFSRPTMREVARVAQCDQSTVSLALRGDPRITPRTRLRIKRVAESMGYTVHPMISAWVSARRSGRPIAERLPLAFLAGQSRHDEANEANFNGARERASRYGFVLTKFCSSDYRSNPQRLCQVLISRGIRGLVLASSIDSAFLADWDWDHFASIAIGRGLQDPILHRVVADDELQAPREGLELHRRLGGNAVDWLVQLILRNEWGLPAERHTLMVEISRSIPRSPEPVDDYERVGV